MKKHERFLLEVDESLAAITPGEWCSCLGSGICEMTAIKSLEGGFVCDLLPDYALENHKDAVKKYKKANMEFIKESPKKTKKLLEMVKVATGALRKYAQLPYFNYTIENCYEKQFGPSEARDALAELEKIAGGGE